MDALAKLCPKCGRRYDGAAAFCQKDGVRLQLSQAQDDPYIGQNLLDQFKIEEKIGAGGMGSVYRARQTTLHRDVAIKILHPELADNADAVRRFKREARVCTALDHPNVVRVFLFGQLEDGSLYIVMEYLDGRSLLEVLRREGALPVHRALHIATQICDGVGEAHHQGVVHRDIKPENVVLVERRRDPDVVKVLDFGIARVLWGDDVTQATQSGLVFGTARYISPEGAAGEPTDARSDVYSLGVLTYQLLSGTTPFEASSPVQMLMKHIHAEAPHLLSHEPARHVPEPIADVVMRALSKNPEGRYDDAHGFADAVRAAATRAGFEVREHRQVRPSIGPPSEPGTKKAIPPAAMTPTPPMSEPPPDPTPVTSHTLEGAPSPFGGGATGELSIPGLRRSPGRGGGKGMGRSIAIAFAVGVVLVGGGFGLSTLVDGSGEEAEVVDVAGLLGDARHALAAEHFDEPRDRSVLGLTAAILAAEPGHADALALRRDARDALVERAQSRAEAEERDQAIALYRRALAFEVEPAPIEEAIAVLEEPPEPPPTPGVRTRPALVIEDRGITLVAVLEPGTELGERGRPRFVLKRGRRQVGRSIDATRQEDALVWEAHHTITRPGRYQLVFRIGTGAQVIERSIELEVQRDPNRPPPRRDPDPPPITTQGSAWTPSVAPAWTPTVENPAPNPNPPPPVNDPPPPPPWTGSVL